MKAKIIGCVMIGVVLVMVGILAMEKLAGAAESGTIELKYAGFLPPGTTLSAPVDEWGKEVEKRTNGKVKVTTYHSQTLGKMKDLPKLVLGGLCDMAFVGAVHPGFELLGAGELPYALPSMRVGMDILNALNRKGLFSSMFEERGFKLLFFMVGDPRVLWFIDKKVTKLSDLKGVKIRGTTPVNIEMLKAMGATAVFVSPPDMYMAMQRKTIDGVLNQTTGAFALKWVETVKYCLWEPMSIDCIAIVMNVKVWDSLPCDVRTVMQDINEEMRYRYMNYYKTKEEYHEMIRKAGVELIEISPQESAVFRAAVEPVDKIWIKDMEKKGVPGKKILDAIKMIVREY